MRLSQCKGASGSCLTFDFEFLRNEYYNTFSSCNIITVCSNSAKRCFSLWITWDRASQASWSTKDLLPLASQLPGERNCSRVTLWCSEGKRTLETNHPGRNLSPACFLLLSQTGSQFPHQFHGCDGVKQRLVPSPWLSSAVMRAGFMNVAQRSNLSEGTWSWYSYSENT